MFRFTVSVLILLVSISTFASISVQAQSRRVRPNASPTPIPVPEQSQTSPSSVVTGNNQSISAALYEDANGFAKRRFEEFAAKKVTFNNALRESVLREQKQLAAKYAAQLQTQKLAGDDFYYLGSLQVLAGNPDAADEAMKQFLVQPNIESPKAQNARSIVAVAAARRKDFVAAETALTEYLKNDPVRLNERTIIERELAENYLAAKNYERAAFHAESAVSAAKPALNEAFANRQTIADFLDLGFLLFKSYETNGANEKAEKTLENMRNDGAINNSAQIYGRATDRLIRFLIEQKRKPEAMRKLSETRAALETKFRDPNARGQVAQFLKAREPQYKLLGEIAPEITIERWIAENPQTLAGLRGRVVLLDFWATWCEPCKAVFPELNEWQENYGKQGLTVIGMTRYYGSAEGFNVDNDSEFTYLGKFKRQYRLNYDIAVGKTLVNHERYAVNGVPTSVLIDKKGTIRFLELGANGVDEELEKLIQKLLAE